MNAATQPGASWRNGPVVAAIMALAQRSDRPAIAIRSVLAGLVFLLFMAQGAGLSAAELVQGLSLGALYGVLGVALVLVYRTNRIINFAAGAIGAIPAITALLLVTQKQVPFLLALPIALVGGPVVGALTDIVVMRRFTKAPRLVATVVTLGLSQTFAVVGFFIPVWFGANAASPPQVDTPWKSFAFTNDRGQPVLTGDQLFAFVVVIALTVGLSLFLSRSRLGIALRASAENADRASLLGIPVQRIGTTAWALAGLLGSMAIFAQAPLIGVPRDATLGFTALLYGLAAAVVGRMDKFGPTLAAGAGIGLIVFASVSRTGTNDLASALMLILILGALLLQRRGGGRALDTGISSFQSVKVFRPIPSELRRLREVSWLRAAGYLGGAAAAIGLPVVVGDSNLPLLQTLPLYGIVAVSLVVLTGWAGQISLGQFGLVGIAAAVAGGLVAKHNIDFFLAVTIAVVVGAAAAVIIGLPAIRIQGLYLAVTTLAFGIAVHDYVLNPNYAIGKRILPDQYHSTLMRPVLYDRINLEDEKNFYYVCVVALVLTILCALAFRRNHSGRTVIALRDNQRAAASYAINPVRTKLAAFAVSGGFAGLAGVLFSYSQHTVNADSYSVLNSISIFLATCIAGLTSVWVAAVGVVAFQGFVTFGPALWNAVLADHQTIASVIPLLITGPLLVYNLYAAPGGLAEQLFGARDAYLRRLATRYRLHVPSLVADRRVEQPVEPARPGQGDNALRLPPELRRAAVAAGPDVSDPSTPLALLSCRGVEVRYDKVQVLFGVDLDVQQGEIIALLGTNGAGKSTLLKAVSGLAACSGGHIMFDGHDITTLSAAETAKLGIVQVPGGKAIFPTLTVAEHFKAGAWLFGNVAPAELAARQEEVLQMFPRVRERWSQLAGNLSGGEQQQLALGMAFLAKPKLLIIDELSLGLSPVIVGQLLDIVRRIHAEGTTIVLVEQSINVALTIATKAFFMEKGEVRFSGPTAELLERDDILRSVFLQGAGTTLATNGPTTTQARLAPPTAERRAVLEVEGLSKHFGGITAVRDVGFTLHEGEILGLVGPNGAGKTTIFDLLSGHLANDGGRIGLSGLDVTRWGPHRRAAAGLGRSFQDARIFSSLTVAENIAIGLQRHIAVTDPVSALFATPAIRESEANVAYTVEDLVELMGLGAFRDKFVSELSTGSRRIVDLAMAIAHDPQVLLLDEPSSGVAQKETEALGPLLLRIREQTGCAVLVIEHDMALITAVSDQIIALELGAVVVQGTAERVLADPRVISAYLGGDLATINRSGAPPVPPASALPALRQRSAANSAGAFGVPSPVESS